MANSYDTYIPSTPRPGNPSTSIPSTFGQDILAWEPGVKSIAVKWDLCGFREEGPACAQVCPTQAIELTDENKVMKARHSKRENAADKAVSVKCGSSEQMNPLVLVLFAVISYGVAALISGLGRHDERDSLRLAGVISAFGGVFGVLAGVSTIVGNYDSSDVAAAANCVVNMDMFSALMVVVISIVTMAASIYSINYLKEYLGKSGWKINILFNIFAAAMTVLVISANVITFMVFMEVVSIASWLIVISDGSLNSRKAGLNYFIVDHIASLLIMAAFLILSVNAQSHDFSAFTAVPLSTGLASLTFLLALVGFGIKAAGIGLHGWLIKAYPISTSYCSTLISCVMVKIGIYGILKFSI